MLLASVALSDANRSFDKLYDYAVPILDIEKAAPGVRVLIPFGPKNKTRVGWIIKVWEGEPDIRVKEISQFVDDAPLLINEMIKLAKWMKTRYFSNWGDCIRLMVPAGLNLKKHIILVINKEALKSLENLESDIPLSQAQKSILEKLNKSNKGLPEQDVITSEEDKNDVNYLLDKGLIIKNETYSQIVNEKTVKAVVPAISKEEFDSLADAGKVRSINFIRIMEVLFVEEICALQDLLLIVGVNHGTVRSMMKKGWVSYCEMEIERDPFENIEYAPHEQVDYTEDQKKVLDETMPLLNENGLKEALLHGVTGSGKTEIYIRLIEEVIKNKKTAIVLVPEISLTPQMTGQFIGKFGNRVAVQHSRLSQGERYDQWRKIKNGQIDVVIGARSAIFAPLTNLGIIIIDEEHEHTYKSEITPKYDARHVARARCNINGCLLVLGSATPSVETYYRALNNRINLLEMKTRPNSMPLPQTILVDLREELKDGNRSIFSRRLEEELVQNKKNGEQSILFLNRRGFASFLQCRECGYTIKCPQCSVSLTLHTYDKRLICHYCGYAEAIPRTCPECMSNNIKEFGSGTQKIEEELINHEAGFRVLRMDMDTTSGKNGHQKIINAFRNKEADILTGTQMVAKGHDFPNVTLVGILSADAMLFTSGYRASERTFQLITQATGRAGRGHKPGRAVIQAYNIDDYAIQTALTQDYEEFYQKEISMRMKITAPPFCHIGLIEVSGEDEKYARRTLEELKGKIIGIYCQTTGFECSDIMPAPIFIVRNRAKWRIIIKLASINTLVHLINEVLNIFPKLKATGTYLNVDIDPASM